MTSIERPLTFIERAADALARDDGYEGLYGIGNPKSVAHYECSAEAVLMVMRDLYKYIPGPQGNGEDDSKLNAAIDYILKHGRP